MLGKFSKVFIYFEARPTERRTEAVFCLEVRIPAYLLIDNKVTPISGR